MARLQNLSQLKAAGGFVSAPMQREVTWDRVDEETGEQLSDTFDIYIARPSLGSTLSASKTPEGLDPVLFNMSKTLFLKNEKDQLQLITYEEADALEPTLAQAIMKVVNEARTPKNLTPQTNSSVTSSPAGSGEAP
jgi:hypothetical protein